MRYTAFCIVDGPAMSTSIFTDLARAGFTSTEVAITSADASLAAEAVDEERPPSAEDVPVQPLCACSMVGATLSLIAGLSAFALPEAVGSDAPVADQAMLDDQASSESPPPSSSGSDPRLERVRTIAYHLCPGKSLISVHTDNGYEIETILEIFRAGGASHCEHIVADAAPDREQPSAAGAALIHDHTTILNDRVRESA